MENSSLEQFPFRLLRQSDVQELWRPELEIVFFLQGTGKVFFSDLETAYPLKQTDVFVVNCFEVRGLELDPNGVALSFLVSQEFVGRIAPELLKRRINCRFFLYEETKQGGVSRSASKAGRCLPGKLQNRRQRHPREKQRRRSTGIHQPLLCQ